MNSWEREEARRAAGRTKRGRVVSISFWIGVAALVTCALLAIYCPNIWLIGGCVIVIVAAFVVSLIADRPFERQFRNNQ